MVRGRVELALFVAGTVLIALQLDLPVLTRFTPPPVPQHEPAPLPRVAADLPVIWREFHPGERQAGPSTTTVRLCGAALRRGEGRSALVLRFCNSQPTTAERRFAFGYDDLRVRAHLPGGITLAYDFLEYAPTSIGGTAFTQGPLPENDAPILDVYVRNVTDIVFVISREIPVGLPSVEVTGRYAGSDFDVLETFEPFEADFAAAERARVDLAPDWATAPY